MNDEHQDTGSGVPVSTLLALMLAVFTVSIGFGVVLPLLPGFIESLLKPQGGSGATALHTGLLTSAYVLALFLFAPVWGRASDRYGRRVILVLGMLGFAGSMFVFSFVHSLPAFYAERFLSGVFAAAVTPVASAVIGDLAATDEGRGRRLTMISVAGIAGFLVGPMLGLLIARVGAGIFQPVGPEGLLAGPLTVTAVFALPVAAAIALAVPGASHSAANRLKAVTAPGSARIVFRLLLLAFIVSGVVGVFEVGLALRGKQDLGLNAGQIALMFTECSLVMIVVQAIVFSPLVKSASTRMLITPALALLAVGLSLVPLASNFTLMLVVIGAVAASAGILLPIFTYWISTKAGNAQGTELGKQTSAASLGSAVGSAAGGVLFDVPFPGASFALAAGLTVIGIALSWGLPRLLAGRDFTKIDGGIAPTESGGSQNRFPLVEGSAGDQREAESAPRASNTFQKLLRLAGIVWVLLRDYRALRTFSRGVTDAEAPAAFAAHLVALGPTFVKLGQILSTRPDVLPQAYVQALSALQETGPRVPTEQIRLIIERELGRPVETLFASFDWVPVASASLAQVHRATLTDGTAVAVKVQRPDLERLIGRDLDAMQAGLQWLSRLFPRRMQRTNLLAFFAEFRRYTIQELDFAHEGHIIDRFRANFAGRPEVKFPTVHWSHTSARVLTMNWVEGLHLREAASSLGPEQKQRLVTLIVDAMLQMFVSDGLFHADLHPGNILFHADGTFTLLDFGMYGELSAVQRDRFILYWFAVVQRQTRRAFHHFKAQTQALPGANENAFYARFAVLAEKFYDSPLSEVGFTKVYLEMIMAGYEYGFAFPSELMLHAKALTTAETLIFVLAPDARFEKLSRPFITREFAARTSSLELLKRRVSQLVPELLLLGEFLPPAAMDESWDTDATNEIFSGLRDRFSDALQDSLNAGSLWQVLLEPHVKAILKDTPLSLTVEDVLRDTWARYYEIEPSIAVASNLGAVFTTHLAAVTLALHEILVRHGIDPAESYRLIYDIGWRFYVQLGEAPLLVASAFTRDPHKRLKLATDFFRTFPFGPPGYEWRDVPRTDGAIAFDCVKCPVAEFFGKHNASELCVATFCRLDFPLAEKWGGRLQRTGTIASGASKCDFCWIPDSSAALQI